MGRQSQTKYERQGLFERDTGNIYLTPETVDASDEDPSNQLLGSSITYRIAIGPQQGRRPCFWTWMRVNPQFAIRWKTDYNQIYKLRWFKLKV